LISHRLTFSSILEEVPLKIRTNPLLSSFLGTLTKAIPSPLADASPDEAYEAAITPSYSALDLGTAGVTRNLEQIVEAVDAYRAEDNNVSYLIRQIARERAKADNYVAKRKEENQARIAQGLVPLPEEDVSRLFKIPAEPSRLESLLLLGQIDAYAKSLGDTSSTNLVKMYTAKASTGI
jgi:translation initiation factor 3 subunit H